MGNWHGLTVTGSAKTSDDGSTIHTIDENSGGYVVLSNNTRQPIIVRVSHYASIYERNLSFSGWEWGLHSRGDLISSGWKTIQPGMEVAYFNIPIDDYDEGGNALSYSAGVITAGVVAYGVYGTTMSIVANQLPKIMARLAYMGIAESSLSVARVGSGVSLVTGAAVGATAGYITYNVFNTVQDDWYDEIGTFVITGVGETFDYNSSETTVDDVALGAGDFVENLGGGLEIIGYAIAAGVLLYAYGKGGS